MKLCQWGLEWEMPTYQIRVAVVQYSDDPKIYFNLKTHRSKKAIIYAVRSLRHKGGRPRNTGAALQFVQDHVFTASSGSRRLEGVPQILFLLTGGKSSDDVSGAALSLKQIGVLSFAIGMKNAKQEELQKIAFSSRFVFNLPVFGELLSIQPEIASPQRDIVFLLDGSDVTRSDFPAMKNFVKRVVDALNVGENKDHVSVVQYSRDPQTDFSLNTYTEKQDVVAAVQQLNHKGGSLLNTGAALDYVRNNAFAESSGSRYQEGVPQILILLSGGRSQDDVASAAAALKRDKVVPFCVGTRNADILEQQMIAHNPSYAFSVIMICVSVSAVQAESIQRDIVFLLDSSDEMQNDFRAMLGFVERMVEKLNVDEDKDRVSVVQYSREPNVEFSLNTFQTKQSLAGNVGVLRHKGGRPRNTGAALQFVKDNVYTASSGSRRQQGVPQILVLFTGGRSSDDIRNAIEGLKQMGVMVFVVGAKNADTLEIQSMPQEASHAFFAADSSDLPDIEEQILSAIKTNPTRKDVVFLLDGSDDSQRRFPDIKDFVQGVVVDLNVSANRDRVAVVQYSNTAETSFNLRRYSTEDDVLDAVRGLRHKGGYPHNIGAALQYVRDYIFTSDSGSRLHEGVPQILILLSGGRSEDDIRTPVRMLKEMGVISIAIGTTDADTLELQTISHEPNYAFSINDYEELPTAKQDVFSLLRETSHHLPAENHIAFVSTSFVFVADSKKQDVVFLIDGSYDSRNGFEEIRGFIGKIVESLNLDENRDRVAVVQYNRDATANFYLNSYSSKNDVLNSIGTMRHKFGRPLNIGKALDFVRDSVFAASVGGRRAESVPQYLYLFSGGRSGDDVRGPAQSLKENGIKTFSIGTKNADTLEMQTISFTPAHYFHVTNFNNLEQLLSTITSHKDTVTPGISMEFVSRDIVFLIDGSDDVRSSFSAVREFVERMVDSFDLNQGKDKVAVVQYSNNAELSFNLNTYNTRDDVLKHVASLQPKGGRPQNIGAALQFVKDKVLVSNAGGRRHEGAKQILVMLAGGRSRDSPRGPARMLKAAGVVTFAIGSRMANSAEMQVISSDPNYAYSVPDFVNLSRIQQSLMSQLTQMGVEEETKEELHLFLLTEQSDEKGRDIVFLLDGSDNTRNGFSAIQDFLYKVIERLDIGPNKDRTAVIQFSNEALANFFLSSFMRKEDVLTAVRRLSHKGGRPVKMGAALKYVKEKVFTAASGSRNTANVPQILVVLNSGASSDSVDLPVASLKESGVRILTIGTKNSDHKEMEKMSHAPSYTLSVAEMAELPSIQEQVVAAITEDKLKSEISETEVIGKNNCIHTVCFYFPNINHFFSMSFAKPYSTQGHL
uniref:VWFA domain-containing protein n=1 Tax=Sparus aurata TaxID=8175 RepID=A0A671VFW9_SPAAU